MALAAAAACTLAACDVLLGLDKYQDVTCALDCGTDAADTGPRPDVFDSAPSPDVLEGGFDADGSLVGDADAGFDVTDAQDAGDVIALGDGALPVPTGREVWAHWPMPNVDAAIAPDSSTMLPHPMTYDAGVEGGAPTVYDAVTKLTWSRASQPASDLTAAWNLCRSSSLPGGPWRVPTRIELVSLIDTTQASGAKIDATSFSGVAGAAHWTSSPVPGLDGGPIAYWTVSFADGLASNTAPASLVLCVSGGPQ